LGRSLMRAARFVGECAMSDLELTLNTNAIRFEQWLDRFSTIPSRILDLNNDRHLSVYGAPTIRSEYNGLIKHEIRALYLELHLNKG